MLARIPFLRVLTHVELGDVGRLVFLIAMTWSLAETILLLRPDLLRPTDLGSDTSNYAAAVQRLTAGHPLYALTPDDRPAPADNAPAWSVPILSPPTLPVVLAPIFMLPGPLGMLLWWVICFTSAVAFAAYLALRAPPLAVWIGVPLAILNAITAWSGNVNALLPGLTLLIWLLAAGDRPSRSALVAAGVLLAIGAALKLGPVIFLPWLLGRGRMVAIASFTVTFVLLGLTTLATVGIDTLRTYEIISSNATQHPTGISPVGIALGLGLPYGLAAAIPAAMVAASAVYSIVWRSNVRLAFAVAAAVSVLASPLVRIESYALLLMCAVPWADRQPLAGRFRLHVGRAVAACGAVSVLLATSSALAAGGVVRSSVSIANATANPIFVRFQITAQAASFGYMVPPNQEGSAWQGLWGEVVQPVLIFDQSCRLLDQAQLPRAGGGMRLAEGGVSLGAPAAAPPLRFSATCAPPSPPQ